MFPIVDLHCDLLSFLAENSSNTVDDPKSNASYSQMRQGNVSIQTLAIFTESAPGAFAQAQKQLNALKRLLFQEANRYQLFTPSCKFSEKISLIPAFENACGFCSETMSIDLGLTYLESVLKEFERILYISLTWDGENRFGGGNGSKAGLKEDGRTILQWMDEKKIAIDLSHTSDYLAEDILNFLDKKSLHIPVIASHSNSRSITNKERNLPDFLIKEVIKRNGLLGVNFFAPFIGKETNDLTLHLEHILSLGGENNLCFGADFFPDLSSDYVQKKYGFPICFFPELNNSSCYPKALDLLKESLNLKDDSLKRIANKNFLSYINRLFA